MPRRRRAKRAALDLLEGNSAAVPRCRAVRALVTPGKSALPVSAFRWIRAMWRLCDVEEL